MSSAARDDTAGGVFGPVPSRRLGRSLGVDVVPFKTCSHDCIYCQLGRTTCLTADREEWVAPDAVLRDVEAHLASRPDYITLSGSGEPTLYAGIGRVIRGIKAMTDIPVAVLTNSSLLWRDDVKDELGAADLVVPSLDAGCEAVFQAVNRPHKEITFERLLEGLVSFRRGFRGACWLEVFLLAGYSAMESELAKLAQCAARVGPDRIQLNTVTRPPAESFAVGVGAERMAELAGLFGQGAEVIADFDSACETPEFAASRADVLEMLRRRPCSLDDIAAGLGMHRNEAVKYVEDLSAGGLLTQSWCRSKIYYQARDADKESPV